MIGIRELKNGLSGYVRRVRQGEIILVTDRGQVVAQLAPARADSVEVLQGLEQLASMGLVRLGGTNDPSLYEELPPLLSDADTRQLLDWSRGDR